MLANIFFFLLHNINMNNIVINSIGNKNVVVEKRAARLKKTILTNVLSFGIIFGSMDSVFCMQNRLFLKSVSDNNNNNNNNNMIQRRGRVQN